VVDRLDEPVALTEALLTASRALVGVAARSLAVASPADVTLPQYRALVVLAARGPLRVGDLAEALGIHPSTATRLCDRLVDRHLVRRAVDRANRRETTISLSAPGRKIVDDVTEVRRAEIRGIVDRIPADLRASAVAALVAFADAAGEPPQEAWTLGWS
jgi:DNA-binding MarR family transcriptional regulator